MKTVTTMMRAMTQKMSLSFQRVPQPRKLNLLRNKLLLLRRLRKQPVLAKKTAMRTMTTPLKTIRKRRRPLLPRRCLPSRVQGRTAT